MTALPLRVVRYQEESHAQIYRNEESGRQFTLRSCQAHGGNPLIMNLQLTDYLLALAALSLSFVGFSTIVVALRQSLGSRLKPFDVLLVRHFIETGFIVTLFSLLPAMLDAAGLDAASTWRLSSALAALFTIVFFAFYLRRRRRTPGAGSTPVRVYVNLSMTAGAVIGLILNAGGWLFTPNGAPYIIALTWLLVQSGLVFLQTLHLFLESPSRDKP